MANTRSNVSALGMPLPSGRNRRKKSALVRPYSAIASHDSAPPMTAQVATARMSVRACSLLAVSRRGSGNSSKTDVSGRTGMGLLPGDRRGRSGYAQADDRSVHGGDVVRKSLVPLLLVAALAITLGGVLYALLGRDSPDLTDYKRIQVGMSVDEVVAQLPGPQKV